MLVCIPDGVASTLIRRRFDVMCLLGCLSENFKGLLYGLQDSIVLHCICFQIRSDTSLCVDKTVPGIQEKCESMQQIFERIDKLEVSDRAYVKF